MPRGGGRAQNRSARRKVEGDAQVVVVPGKSDLSPPAAIQGSEVLNAGMEILNLISVEHLSGAGAGAGDQNVSQETLNETTEDGTKESEHFPDCSTVGPDCGCTKLKEIENFESHVSYPSNPPYIKDSKMPITLLSLRERVIALAHQPCAVCLIQSPTFQCRGCYMVSYCSIQHQSQHWTIHQTVCLPITYLSKPGLEEQGISAQMKACRDVPPNTVLFQVDPAIIGPIDKKLGNRFPDSSLCLGCCSWFSFKKSIGRCSKCQWPVCSPECEFEPWHADYECQFFVKHRVPPCYFSLMYDGILALRCLLLKTMKPDVFEKFVALQNIAQIRDRSVEALKEDKIIAKFLEETCKVEILLDIDHGFIMTFLKIVEICSVIKPEYLKILTDPEEEKKKQIEAVKNMEKKRMKEKLTRFMAKNKPAEESEENKQIHMTRFPEFVPSYSVRYVFPIKHTIVEECAPNTRWIIHHGRRSEECYLRVVAAIPIQCAQPITVCWNTDSEFGTMARRRMSNLRFSSSCFCSRCVDETENGSEFGTFLCEDCAYTRDPDSKDNKMLVGLVRPSQPLDNASDWSCSTNGCSFQLARPVVMARLGQLLHEVECAKEDLYALAETLSRHSKILHRNHYICIRAKHYIISKIVQQVQISQFESVTLEHLRLAGSYIEDCLFVHELITPGESLIRGRLLFQRQLVQGVYNVRQAKKYMNRGQYHDLKQFSEIFMTLHRTQLVAYNIVKDDSRGTFNHECAFKLKRIIEEFDDLIRIRSAGEQLTKAELTRIRLCYARMTDDIEMRDFELHEDTQLYTFKLSPNHIPPINPEAVQL